MRYALIKFLLFRKLLFLYFFIHVISGYSQSNTQFSFNDNSFRNKLIRCIINDEKNRVWCGTDDGIFCFDGYDVISFKNTSQFKKISDNYILSCCSNSESNIIVFATNKGLTWINTKSMKTYFMHDSITNQNNITDISSLVYAGKNQFCFASHSKLFSLRLKSSGEISEISEVKLERNVIQSNKCLITSIASDNLNEMIFVTDYSHATIVDSKNLLSQKKFGPFRSICQATIWNDSYIIASFEGLNIVNRKTNEMKNIPLYGITSMHTDNNLNLWLVINKTSIFKLDKFGSIAQVYKMNIEQESRYQHVFCVTSDNRNLWVGTSKGLFSVQLPKTYFNKVISQSTELNSGELSSRGMLQINDTNVLLCGYHYFKSYNPITGALSNVLTKKEAESISPYSLCRTGDTIWIASEGGGINLFSLRKNKFFTPSLVNKKHLIAMDKGFYRTTFIYKNCIYFSEYGFIVRINYNTGEIVSSLQNDDEIKEKLSDVSQVLSNSKNELMVINNYSILIIDTNFNVIKKFYPSKFINAEMGILNCMTINQNKAWIGTASRGLFMVDVNTNKYKQWTTDNGLSDNSIYSLFQDDSILFIGTKNGLSVFDLNTEKFKNFYEEDGLMGNEFNGNSYLKLTNGDLLMGGVNGVTRIRTNLLNDTSDFSKLFFSKIIVNGSSGILDSVIISDIENMKEVLLPYEHRFLKVCFSLTNYSSNNRFAYKLEGTGNKWIEIGSQNNITFNSLEPGNYILQIKAWDDSGEMIPKQLKLSIKAEQVFYKRSGFLLVLILILLTFVFLGFYFYYKIKIKNIQRLANLRLKIASELHDQVGGLLNKTAIQAELVSAKNKDKSPQLEKIALNSRTALSSMRDILWNLDPRNDNTASLIERMKEYVLRMLQDDFDYSLNIEGVENIELSHEIRQNLNMIFKEAINNIVKHAPGSKVKIFFGLKDGQLQLSVHSSNSLKTDLISTGQGLRNMKMRAKAIKATFTFNDKDGVEICVVLPLYHIKM